MPLVREMTGNARLSRHLPVPLKDIQLVTKSPLWSSTLAARRRPAVVIIFSWNDQKQQGTGHTMTTRSCYSARRPDACC